MAVAHDASVESHTGTTGSTSAASYNWTHTPVGTPRGILIESKEDLSKRLQRSPDKGDAVVMCLSEGNAAVKRQLQTGGHDQGGVARLVLLHAASSTARQPSSINQASNPSSRASSVVALTQ